MRKPLLLSVAALSIAALLVARGASANCGAEGCPLTPQGAEFSTGRFSFGMSYQSYVQDRHWDGTSEISAAQALAIEGGLGHIVEQETRTKMWTMQAHVQLMPRLRLDVSLPYVDRIHRHALAHHTAFFIPSQWHMTGLGDGSALASWTLPWLSSPATGEFTLQAGVKLPTGQTKVDEVGGESPEAAARPGSGSTDLLAGVQYRRGISVRSLHGDRATLPVSLAASMRWNGRGTDDYRMGDEWDVFASTAYPLTRHLRLTALATATGHARDETGNTDAEPHSTGSVAFYAAPGLMVDLGPGMALFASQQLRLYEHTNGVQLVSPYHLSFGLRYALR